MTLECFSVIIICTSAFFAAFVFFLIALLVTFCESNRSPQVLPQGADLIHSITEFENLIKPRCDPTNADNAKPATLAVPFQLAKFGRCKIYTHHITVVGYARNTKGDYLLLTVEYTSGGRCRGWSKCCRLSLGCLSNIRRLHRRIWGRIKLQILLLSEEISEERLILLLRDENLHQTQCCPNAISEDEAKKILWDDGRIKELLQRHRESSLDLHKSEENIELGNDDADFWTSLERNRRNEHQFRALATRLKPILNETKWSANFNSCEHLANYLLTGRHWSRQLDEAHFFKLLLLHMLGPTLEMSWAFRISALIPHVVAVFLASLVHDQVLYMICITLAYFMEFLSAAWVISGVIGLEAQGRTAGCVRVVLEAFTKSVLNAAAISIGCLAGHWLFRCLPSIWDEVLLSSAFFLVSHFIIYPLLAAIFDSILRLEKTKWSVFGTRVVTMALVIVLPTLLLVPYFFAVLCPTCTSG